MSAEPAVYLIGGGPLAARVPRLARELGLAPIVADRDPSAPGFAHAAERLVADGTAAEEHVAFARSLRGRFAVRAVYCGGEHGLEAARRVAVELGLPASSEAAIARALDKVASKEAFRAAGVPTPEGIVVADAGELRAAMGEGRWILKPSGGSGSRGVRIVRPKDDLAAALDVCRAAAPGAVLAEPFLEGRSIDANGLLRDGEYVPLGVLEKYATPPPSRLPLGGYDPAALPDGEAEEVYAIVERGARALGLAVGPVKADLLRTAEGYVLLEVAPRFHGDVTTVNTLPFGSGIDPMRALFEGSAGASGTGNGFAAWRVICLPPGRVERWPDPRSAEDHPDVTLVWHNPRVAERIPRYDDTTRIPGYACACGQDRDEAEEALAGWFAAADYRIEADEAERDWYRALGEELDAIGFTRAGSGYVEAP